MVVMGQRAVVGGNPTKRQDRGSVVGQEIEIRAWFMSTHSFHVVMLVNESVGILWHFVVGCRQQQERRNGIAGVGGCVWKRRKGCSGRTGSERDRGWPYKDRHKGQKLPSAEPTNIRVVDICYNP